MKKYFKFLLKNIHYILIEVFIFMISLSIYVVFEKALLPYFIIQILVVLQFAIYNKLQDRYLEVLNEKNINSN